MRSPLKWIVFALSLLCANCSSSKSIVSADKLKRALSFSIELTDLNQKIAGDSLGSELARRLLVYADERNDFILVKPGDNADFRFKIRISSCNLVPTDTQFRVNQKRNAITNKYDKINDSIALEYKPNPAASAAMNVAANVALNAALLPLGFVGMVMIDDGPQRVYPNADEQGLIDSLSKSAYIGYDAKLFNSKNRIVWKKAGIEYYKLDYTVSEKEQLRVLIRNVVLQFEGKMPFLVIR